MVAEQAVESRPRRDILDRLWHLASGPTARLVLLAGLALSLLGGSLWPQLPPAEAADPTLASRWLNTTAARYGVWGTALRTVGLFDIAHALWFRLLLALLAFHLLLRAAEAAQAVAMALSGRRPPLPSTALPQEVTASLPPPLAEAAQTMRARLAASGLCMIRDEETATGVRLYAERGRPGLFAPLLANVGALLLLLGLFVNDAWGWQRANLLLAPGQETALGHDTGLSLRLETTAGDDGQLLFRHERGESVARPLAFARPARYGGLSVYQTGDGPALVVRGQDEAGHPLALQPLSSAQTEADMVSLVFEQPQAERHLTAPEANLALRVVAQPTRTPADPPSWLVEAYRGGSVQPILETAIGAESTLTVGDVRFELRPARYRLLQVVHAPGLALLLAGGLLLLLSTVLPLFWPAEQVWTELVPERRAISVRLAGQSQGLSVTMAERLALLAQAIGGTEETATLVPHL
ncbi:MAG: cytochrome c biogenesis protein ResB [Anaerolineae bacterium]|nr:cytochrome c biogenesis protein ResB [Anaerolineae bacterium]